MTDSRETGGYLIVVEHGARWDGDAGVDASCCAVVPQQADETPAELAMRAARRTKHLTERRPLDACIIAAADSSDDEVFHSRCQIARHAVAAMRGAPEPKLVFVAPEALSEAARHELMAIAGTLTSQLHGTPVEVRIRFESRKGASSGVHRVADAKLLGVA